MNVLDTDILVDVQRGHAPAMTWFNGLTEVPCVPGLVVMELVQDAQNLRQVRQVLKLIAALPVVWPTVDDCNRALADFISFHFSHGLGMVDALIASCAIGQSAGLCTFNDKHYHVIAGLTILHPYTR